MGCCIAWSSMLRSLKLGTVVNEMLGGTAGFSSLSGGSRRLKTSDGKKLKRATEADNHLMNRV